MCLIIGRQFEFKCGKTVYLKWFFLFSIFIIIAFIGSSFLKEKNSSKLSKKFDFNDGSVCVHFIDVGQGDCTLIADREKTVLVDCGEVDKGVRVAKYLKNVGIAKIDYFIATHPHTDHIGGFVDVAERFKVENVIMSNIPSNLIPTNPTYEKFLKFLKNNKIKVLKPNLGDIYNLGKGKLQILGPVKQNYKNLNDFSVACRFDVENSSFLLCGDAQEAAEHDLLKSGQNLKADVFKLSHHGSHTSNQSKFLKKVGAKIFVVSVGRHNKYGHPNRKVLKRLNKKLYRTDRNGSVVFKVKDGSIKTECERGSKLSL